METIINHNGSLFLVIRQWLDKEYANELFENLDKNVKWYDKQYGKDGNLYKMKRKISMLGDGSHLLYPYEKIPFEVTNWDQILNSEIKKIKDDICKDNNIQSFSSDLEFNSCIVNKYTANDFISYHSDFEAKGVQQQVVSVSLGGSRTFHIKKNNSFERPIQVVLNHGDLLLMLGNCQRDYQHAIHSEKNVNTRISLTYRYI